MTQLEQSIDRKLGIADTNRAGQRSQVESAIDTKLGIEPVPEPTFEEKEKRIRDVFDLSDKLEIPYRKVLDDYDEIQRQKKDFPFGKLQAGEDEFSARKLFRNLYDKVRPPALGEASPGQIFHKLKEGVKGAGHIGMEYLIGKRTLGFADMLAAPIEAFKDVYLANKKLREDLVSQGNTVTDVGTKYDPVWKITDSEDNVEFITPNTVADKEFASSVAELYDRIVGLEVSPAKKKWGEVAKIIGTFKGVAKLRGPMPQHIGALGKAGHAFQVGTIYGIATELRKGIMGNESYRGTIGVIEDGIALAALSLIGSGVGGIWGKLKPTEQSKALKLLGLKRGATEQQVKSAARKAFLQYHPDKVTGMQAEFQKAVKARNILLNPDYGKDIVYQGTAPSAAKLLTGITEEGVPIKPVKPPIKIEPETIVLTPVAPPVAKVAPEGIKVPPKAAEGKIIDKPKVGWVTTYSKGAFGTDNLVTVKDAEGNIIGQRDPFYPAGIPVNEKRRTELIRKTGRDIIKDFEEKQLAKAPPAAVAEPSLPIPQQHKGKTEFWEGLHRRREVGQSALSQEEELVVQQIRDSSSEFQQALKDYEAVESFTPEGKKAARKVEKLIRDIDVQVQQMPIEEVRKRLPEQAQPPAAVAEIEGKELPLSDEEFDKFTDGLRPGFVDIEPDVDEWNLPLFTKTSDCLPRKV